MSNLNLSLTGFDAQVNLWNGNDRTRGFGTLFLIFNGGQVKLKIEEFKIVEGNNGVFVGWPQRKKPVKDQNTGKDIWPYKVKFYDNTQGNQQQGQWQKPPVQIAAEVAILAAYDAKLNGGNQTQGNQGGYQQQNYQQAGQMQGDMPQPSGQRPSGYQAKSTDW